MAIALDIETTGLNPWKDDIVAIGVGLENGNTTTYTPWDEEWQDIHLVLERMFEDEVICHNAAFDMVWLRVKFGLPIPDAIWDTMIAESLLTAGYADSVALAELMLRRFHILMDKDLQTSFTLDEKPSDAQLEYLETDVKHLFDIRQQQIQEIEAEGLEDVWYDVEKPVTSVFCRMIYEGVKVNVDKLSPLIEAERQVMTELMNDVAKELTPLIRHERIKQFDKKMAKVKEYERKVEEKEAQLRTDWMGGVLHGQDWQDDWHDDSPHPKGGVKGCERYVKHHMKTWREYNKRPPRPKLEDSDINLGSPQQVLAAFRELGVPLVSTKEADLKAAIPEAPDENAVKLIQRVLRYKKAAKLVQAFGDSLMKFIDDEGKLHSSFRQYGTETGRPTAREPNLLQMPNTPEFRDCFVPDEGEVMVICDYSQMELREMAQLSNDRNMVVAFREGLDLHQNTAALMYDVPYEEVTEKQRKLAKTVNFGTLYGMGPHKLIATMASDGVYLTLEEAKDTLNKWKQAYPQAARAILQWGNDATAYGYTQTAFGRRRRFRLVSGMPQGELGRIRRQGANHVIQGTNADITKLAMVMIDRMLRPIGGKIRLQIYDEIVATVPEEHAEEGADIVYACMKAAAEEVLINVPAMVDCVISKSWSEKAAID